MATGPFPYITPEQYLAIEREAEYKSEYIDGVMYPRIVEHCMAGGLPSHSELAMGIGAALRLRLRRTGCRIFTSDLKIGVSLGGPYFYPDLSVTCGDIVTHVDKEDVLMNTLLLVEVTSRSTEAMDRGLKFAQYKRIPTLREFVLISQLEPRIEVFTRSDDGHWASVTFTGPDAICHLKSVNCNIPLAEIYEA